MDAAARHARRTRAAAVACLAAILLAAPATARADWHLTPFLGLTFKGSTTIVDWEGGATKTHWDFGGSVAVMGEGPFGVEGLVAWTPGFFQQEDTPTAIDIISSRTLALMGNAVFTTPKKWNEYGLRPFVSGGIGLLHAQSTDSLVLIPVNTNLLGYNVGGGAVGFLTDHTGLRFDLRYFSNLKPSDDPDIALGRVHLSYWTTTVGVVFRY
jgi:hypothetical protein